MVHYYLIAPSKKHYLVIQFKPHSTTRYILLTEFEVCTGRTEFFSPLFDLWLKHRTRKAIKGKNEDP